MAAPAGWVLCLCLCLGWSCLCLPPADALRPCRVGLRRRAAPGDVRDGSARAAAGDDGPGQRRHGRLPAADRVAEHMLRLYEQYRGTRHPPVGPPLPRGNTVRGFRPLPTGRPEDQEMYVFNLTSLTESENVLSASVYYYIGDLLRVKWNCSQSSGCSRHRHRRPDIQICLSVWAFPSVGNQTRSLGHFLINVSTAYPDILSWQWKDITRLLHEAKQNNELLISVKMALSGHHPWERASSCCEPYILIYANDSAISEPESVISTLRGHRHPLARVFPKPESHVRSSLGKHRRKRSANILLPLQNNELPGAEYWYSKKERGEDRKPYKTFQPPLAERAKSKKKQRKNHPQKSQTLQFDEQTLKKARRKQWNEPRYCARRYLKVDFADIGWSEWIISPKSFDAYYCSGECQFPIPKALKPSNHATIQSIVRAVGVVPGIPEPCCVPDKMSSLSILFFDENKNVVLKVYPNMTVESCACR
ncbi:bone morphogenetic protein 3 isoform X2 [Myiozetetes cayanensis]|uniref:bone morphogenetic protein 3 isoform X2 n=1 Tax=Myiozetetes cayanensis TaxID=478635 RepID=UPI002160958F|nr:bone morphogenetic protein 3 isoform X2 [Myiozetetes cayanensis]XP_050188793.1 bone morphogenetic protein 3 isoform X2 [Myiozetetes cayanensis]XP_050188794.1 bone morphogenetic protein 3 isoform X2 [Myiozetetes cayanensis]XP_050188796.1 bone morphogenetic protein 3 isoform X2 [Myiozetetes cayanensis]